MDADEKLTKHIDLVQGVINRMAGNSFLLKGWSVTLVAGLFALAASGGNWTWAALGLLPSISFWWLDAWYFRHERLFRALHDAVRWGQLNDDLYCLDAAKYAENAATRKARVGALISAAFSPSVVVLHGVVVATVVVLTIVLLCRAWKGA